MPTPSAQAPLVLQVKQFRAAAYEPLWQAMKDYTDSRNAQSPDQIWCVEHSPVFTQGQAGKPEHILQNSNIPLVQSDRGGQVTYHGPGQVVLYFLINLKRHGLSVREFVSLIEQQIIQLLAKYNISAELKDGAPGVYVAGQKIASLGLRVRKGCTYHGLSLNVDMDLAPFQQINPCGYAGLSMTQMSLFAEGVSFDGVERELLEGFVGALGYGEVVGV